MGRLRSWKGGKAAICLLAPVRRPVTQGLIKEGRYSKRPTVWGTLTIQMPIVIACVRVCVLACACVCAGVYVCVWLCLRE